VIPELTVAETARFRSRQVPGGCGLIWSGPFNNMGYGRLEITRGGRRVRILAHRLAYKLATSEDPGALKVLHACDTPPCCTPGCLRLGTQADNLREALERDRMVLTGLLIPSRSRASAAIQRLRLGVKCCSRCGIVKPLADFFRNRNAIDGRHWQCKACVLEQQRQRRRSRRGVAA
jgi:hypothetical protein